MGVCCHVTSQALNCKKKFTHEEVSDLKDGDKFEAERFFFKEKSRKSETGKWRP